VINFSFGGGLYFALVEHYNDGNVAMGNDNSTRYMHTHAVHAQPRMYMQYLSMSCSAIYLVWLSGVRMIIEGTVLTYYGPGGFK